MKPHHKGKLYASITVLGTPSFQILLLGGRNGGNLDEMLVLDRKTSQWKKLVLRLPNSVSYGGAAYLNEEIYIFGGYGQKPKTYKFDANKTRWIELAEMNESRASIQSSSLVVDGCIWVLGGRQMNSGEKYCPGMSSWIMIR